MNLVKEHWDKNDIIDYQNYLLSLSKGEEKEFWEQRICNTKLPCIAVPSPLVKKVVNEIYKGNFMEFLDLWVWENFTNTTIIGGLICKIKDKKAFKKYLDKYSNCCDNWATCDSLKFPIKENNKDEFFEISKEYIKSPKPFVRRVGITILFKLIEDKYISEIFKILNSFENETEYYVNMVNAWLVAECFTKKRDETLEFLETNKLNKFTVNKAISKCRDSFRISKEDKEMLLCFRKN